MIQPLPYGSWLTYSWVSAKRMPLRSGIPTPFRSLRMRPLVKRQRDDLGRRGRATNVHAETGPRLGHGRWHVGHPDVVAKGEGDVSRRHRPDPPTIADDAVAVAWNAAVQHLEANQLPREAPLARRHDGVAADEILLEIERPIEPCLKRIRLRVHVITVEAHPRFEAKGVAGAQAGRPDAIGPPLLQQRAPQSHGVGVAAKKLEAILSRVAGPRDRARHIRNGPLDEGIVLDTGEVRRRQPLNEVHRPRALHADQRPLSADIAGRVRGLGVFSDPVEVAVLVAGIDPQQVAPGRPPINEPGIDAS